MTDRTKHRSRLMARLRRLAGVRRAGERFREEEQGVAAMEFALLALPFFALLFGILELAIVFFISAALDHGTSQAARLVRTNQIDSSGSKEERLAAFRTAVCSNMAVFKDCETRLIIDLKVNSADSSRFVPDILPEPATYNPDFDRDIYDQAIADGDTPPVDPPAESFDVAGADVTVVLRAQYVHQLVIGGGITRLSNDKNNTRRLTSITAFKNEPF